MKRELKLLGILVVLAIAVQPTMAEEYSIHVVNMITGQSVSIARVEIWQGSDMAEWGYTDNYGDYNVYLTQGENYLIKASSYNYNGAKRISVDTFTPRTIEVGIQ